MTTLEWKEFLESLSQELLADENMRDRLPEGVLDSGWLGFDPASESEIQSIEKKIGKPLPRSLRTFYAVTNGWRIVGLFIWNILPVEEIGWLRQRVPDLYRLAQQTENTQGPFKDDPEDQRLKDYRFEQGTRVKRSLVLTSEGDASTWLLDPRTRNDDGEWAGGRWSSWNPAMEWSAESFSQLVKQEFETYRKLR